MPGWILVADPDLDDRMLAFNLLEHEGHRATVVGDGHEALALLRAEPFDLLLVDLGVPGTDGLEVVRTIKGDPRLSHIPVIITTDTLSTKSVTRCLEMGAEDYLPKPVDPVLLRVRITAGLVKKRLHDLGAEYEDQLRCLAEAAVGIGSEAFVSADLERLSRGTDGCGHVARALLRTAAEVRGREQQLRDEVASLQRQAGGARNRDA